MRKRALIFITTNLTHWGWVTHICGSNLTVIRADNGLSLGWHQAIIQTNARILSTGPLGTNFIEVLIQIHIFSFKKMHLKMLSRKWQPFCHGLNVLIDLYLGVESNPSHSCIQNIFITESDLNGVDWNEVWELFCAGFKTTASTENPLINEATRLSGLIIKQKRYTLCWLDQYTCTGLRPWNSRDSEED